MTIEKQTLDSRFRGNDGKERKTLDSRFRGNDERDAKTLGFRFPRSSKPSPSMDSPRVRGNDDGEC
jgi:hypothetical protein